MTIFRALLKMCRKYKMETGAGSGGRIGGMEKLRNAKTILQ
jgi:hypothetical protein